MNTKKTSKYAFALAVGLPFAAFYSAEAQTIPQSASSGVVSMQAADDAYTDLVQELKKEAVAVYINFPTKEEIAEQEKQPPACRKSEPAEQGSGYVVDAEKGLIATNNHVAGNAHRIKVKFSDGEERTATLVGADSETDIALIKVDVNPAKPLHAVTFGNSDNMLEGRGVIAIGNPLGLAFSITSGILSAKNRSVNPDSPFDNFLQVDAAINRGNSGGPLFNLKGELSGMNTAIYSTNGGSIGLGFAIPSNEILEVITHLQASGDGKMHYGSMGVKISPVDEQTALLAGMDTPHGFMINEVIEDSPAERAGLAQGDVILSVDGKEEDTVTKFVAAIARLMEGHEAHIKYLRDGNERDATVVLGKRPSKDIEAESSEDKDNAPDLTPEEKDQAWKEFQELPDQMKGFFLQQLPNKVQKEFMERYQAEECEKQRQQTQPGIPASPARPIPVPVPRP